MAKEKLGYWLSIKDLDLIEQVNWLKKIGVKEFFVRGFSKPADCIHRTVKAHKIVRDAKDMELNQAIEEA